MEDKNEDLQTLVNKAAWVHNKNISKMGHVPLTVMTGQTPKYPLVDNDDDDKKIEEIGDQVDKVRNVQKLFLESEIEKLLKDCAKARVPSFKHDRLKENDMVLVQHDELKKPFEWHGPYKVCGDKNDLIVKVETENGICDISRTRVARHYTWKGMFDNDENDKDDAIKSINEVLESLKDPPVVKNI